MRAFTDGFGVEVLVGKNLGTRLKQPFQIGLDAIAGMMYWTDRDTGLIQRANLDGTNVTTVLALEFQKKPGNFRPSSPTGFALNLIGDRALSFLGLLFLEPEVPQVVPEDHPGYYADREDFKDESRSQFTAKKVVNEAGKVADQYAGSNKEGEIH